MFGFPTHSQTFPFLPRKCFSPHLAQGGGIRLVQSCAMRLRSPSRCDKSGLLVTWKQTVWWFQTMVSAASGEKLRVGAGPSASCVWGKVLEHFSWKEAPRSMAQELLCIPIPCVLAKNREMGSVQDSCIWIFEAGAVVLCCGEFRGPSWEAVTPGKMPQAGSVPSSNKRSLYFCCSAVQHRLHHWQGH